MGTIGVDGNLLKKMIIAGTNALNRQRHEIDDMNVFPVPDGDTGTNMSMTVLAAAREADKLYTPNIFDVAKAASGGSLRGARGNSGVILSQLFRGFAKGLENVAVAQAQDLAKAFGQAAETAYKAVMKPKEGTILTIAKAISEQAVISANTSPDLESFMDEVLSHANEMLLQTPKMLPELMRAGVVDAGGKGLLLFLQAAVDSVHHAGEPLLEIGAHQSHPSLPVNLSAAATAKTDIRFGYCTEFFIHAKNISEEAESQFKNYLESMGDSIVAVADDELMKIHVHTNHPGSVLEKAILIGAVSNIKIDNMRFQHTSLINFSMDSRNQFVPNKEKPKKDVGFVSVSFGRGFYELFVNFGADEVIEGGQTMNPSTEDILQAIERVNADCVFVLPNNKNIILTAEQAAQLCPDKTVFVLPTRSIPQGLTAIISYTPSYAPNENQTTMRQAMEKMHTLMVTGAARDTTVDGSDIKKGDYLFMLDEKIIAVSRDLRQGMRNLIDQLAGFSAEVISIYYGADTPANEADEFAAYTREKYPQAEVEVVLGGQPIYNYIISAE